MLRAVLLLTTAAVSGWLLLTACHTISEACPLPMACVVLYTSAEGFPLPYNNCYGCGLAQADSPPCTYLPLLTIRPAMSQAGPC